MPERTLEASNTLLASAPDESCAGGHRLLRANQNRHGKQGRVTRLKPRTSKTAGGQGGSDRTTTALSETK